jgi:hypothetical protein
VAGATSRFPHTSDVVRCSRSAVVLATLQRSWGLKSVKASKESCKGALDALKANAVPTLSAPFPANSRAVKTDPCVRQGRNSRTTALIGTTGPDETEAAFQLQDIKLFACT